MSLNNGKRWALAICAGLLGITHSIAQAQNQGYLYVADESHSTLDVLRASDHVLIASIPTINTPYGVAVTQDGKRAYVSTYDGKNIYCFDTETNALVSTLQFGSELREITLTPDDKYLYVPDYYENVVHIVSTKENKLVGNIPVGVNPHMVAFGRDGKFAYVTAEAGQVVTVIDTKKATVAANISVGETPIGIAASPDTNTIYVASYNAYQVSFISTKTQSVEATVSLPSNASAVAASPDGKFVYAIGDNPKKGYVISVETKSIVSTFPVGSQPRNVIASPDGETIYVANFDSQNLYAINAQTYQLQYKKALGSLDGIALSNSPKPVIENYQFKTVDYPGGQKTEVRQVNDHGYAVGAYYDVAQVEHGFIYHRGEFINYDFPGAQSTQLNGINSANMAVGNFTNSQGQGTGFQLFDSVAGIINLNVNQDGQQVTVPAGTAEGIDDDGTVVGVYWSPAASTNLSFRLDGLSHEDFDFPDAIYTQAEGATGPLVIGWFIDGEGNFHGLRWKGDEYSQFDFAGGGVNPNGGNGFTFAFKVNDARDIVGSWGTDLSNPITAHGYLIEGKSQREISFDYPDALSTSNHGINDKGQITGSYIDRNNVMHGFIATPKVCSH